MFSRNLLIKSGERKDSGTGADEICIKGAKGLAMTGLDLLLNESLRQAAAKYHEKVVPDFYKEK